jgi:hypothetical protein
VIKPRRGRGIREDGGDCEVLLDEKMRWKKVLEDMVFSRTCDPAKEVAEDEV